MVDERKVFLRFGSYWKSPQKSTRHKILQGKNSLYRDQTQEFKCQCIPQGGVRKIARDLVGGGLGLGVFLIVVAAVKAIPTLERQDQFQQAFQYWLILGMLIIGVALILHSCWKYRKLTRSSWIDEVTHHGVHIISPKKERFVPWSDLKLLSGKFLLQRILLDDKDTAFLPPSSECLMAVRSRLLLPEPKLFTGGFFLVFFISIVSVPLTHLVYRSLDVTPEPDLWIVSVIMPLFSGLLVMHHRMALRAVRKANESLEQNFPMNL